MGGMGSPGTVAMVTDDLMFASRLSTTMKRAGGTAVVVSGDVVPDVALMFVDPSAIGGGAGRTLFEKAVRVARRLGYRRMAILADPNAAPFYQRMGARFVRNAGGRRRLCSSYA